MDIKSIDNIVWWIPFNRLRNSVRDYFNSILYIEKSIQKILISENKINNDENEDQKMIWFKECIDIFKSLDSNGRFPFDESNLYPILTDNTSETPIDSQYIYHTAWAARVLNEISPDIHIDISSRTTFNAIVSAFIPIEFYDIRPANITLDNLKCKKANITNLHFADNSIESISCMHTIEHIGLGRYGDNIDPDGDLKAINELKRVCKVGGSILFVVPISGIARLHFNAHRIYSYDMIIEYFKYFKLVEFSLIPDNANDIGIIKNSSKKDADSQEYGLGLFWFEK